MRRSQPCETEQEELQGEGSVCETPIGVRAGPVLLRAGNCGKSQQRRRGGRAKSQAPRIRWAGKVLTVSRPSPHLVPLTPLPAPSSYRGRDAISLKAVPSEYCGWRITYSCIHSIHCGAPAKHHRDMMVSKTRLGSSWSFLVGKTGINQITTQMET